MKIITVANLKGGSAKSTTTAFLAHAYAAEGLDVLVIDADPQGSTLRWSEAAEWTIPTLALPVKNLHTRLTGIVPSSVDVVLIDTPPLDDHAGIVYSALRVASTIIITMAPTMMEFERLADVWAAVEEVEPLRTTPAQAAVLLNRTVPQAASTEAFRGLIVDAGHTVLTTTINRREMFAQAFGAPITDLGRYADAAAEIFQLEATA